jgi:stress response protein SCP2
MKKAIRIALPLIAIVLMMVVGCHHNPATTVPAGAINQFDATAYRILSDAQAAIEFIKKDVDAKTITLTDQQKAIFNQLIMHYNTAEAAAQAYHANGNGQADTSTLTTALNQVIADIAAVSTQIQGATTRQKTATAGGVQ